VLCIPFYVQCDVLRLLLISVLSVIALTHLVARQEMASGIFKNQNLIPAIPFLKLVINVAK